MSNLVVTSIDSVPVESLASRLGWRGIRAPLAASRVERNKPLTAWRMEDDDAPILRHIYRNARPRRHLEFGTWRGFGTLLCLEECDATVWTINLLDGEIDDDGRWVYDDWAPPDADNWLNTRETRDGRTVLQSDARGEIGRLFLERDLGHRVCQTYADSRRWDITNYPAGFFDSAFIDGGHSPDVVANDTEKALDLVRSGGLLIWHDYCPDEQVRRECSSTRGVYEAIHANLRRWRVRLDDFFWIDPSWILVGVRGGRNEK